MNEADFHEVVEEALLERFEHVEHDPEDVTSDVIQGAGQAFQYASELALERSDAGVVPVVICNADAFEPDCPEVEGLRLRLPVVPLDPQQN